MEQGPKLGKEKDEQEQNIAKTVEQLRKIPLHADSRVFQHEINKIRSNHDGYFPDYWSEVVKELDLVKQKGYWKRRK